MKRILVAFLLVLFFYPLNAVCEVQTITHTVRQPFGGSQSPDDARISAIAKAKREALEKAGVYVEALTIVKDAKVDKDEILAITAGVVKSEVVSQKNYALEEAFGIEVVVKVIVDQSVMEGRVKKLLQDRTHLEQLNQARKKEKELLATVARLERENRLLIAQNKSSKDLQKNFREASQGLTAVDWVNKALALRVSDQLYTDPQKAITYLDEAVRLKPDYALAYNIRGIAYAETGQRQRAIKDFEQSIKLVPNNWPSYYNRGLAYQELKQYQRGIKDYDEAIRLKPDFALPYNNRGIAYNSLGQYKRAIQDYNEAIRLKPDFTEVYYNRGNIYRSLGQHKQAIKDYNDAIRLKPDFALAYNNRGASYTKTGQYQQAIKDYNEVIRLKPDFALAYNNRGAAYLLSQNNREACLSFIQGCKLGNCTGYETSKKHGLCR